MAQPNKISSNTPVHHRRMLAQVRAHASSGGISDSDESRHDIGIGSRNHRGMGALLPGLLAEGGCENILASMQA